MDHGHVDDRLSELLIEQDNKAKLPTISEISRIQHGVEQVLKTALDIVQKNDSRLTGTLLPVGSYYSDLKIGLPDEFDFLYELQTFEEDVDFIVRPSGFRGSRDLWRTPSGNPAKRKIQIVSNLKSCHIIKEDREESWVHRIYKNRNGHDEYVLHPVHVKNSLYFGIMTALKEIDKSLFPKYLLLDSKEEATFFYGPACTLFFIWNGRFYKNLKISVDVTLCIRAFRWEGIVDCLQPGMINEQSCLKRKIYQGITHHGYHLIPFISDRGHIQWKISTSYLETQILSKFSKDSSFKRLIRIVKNKKSQHLVYRPNPDFLHYELLANAVRFFHFYSGHDYDEEHRNLVSSYLIKNVVFQLCGYATSSEWSKASLSTLYFLTLATLYRGISLGNCRNFFISKQKLSVPEHGDILPGFFRIFNEMDEHFNALHSVHVPLNWEELYANPFNPRIARTFYGSVRDIVERSYHYLWNEDNGLSPLAKDSDLLISSSQ